METMLTPLKASGLFSEEKRPRLTGNDPKAVPAGKRIPLDLLFLAALFMALASGKYLWVSRIGWAVLPILYVVDFRYAVCSIFFFATFFQPSGFLPDLFFTVKHFHVALGFAGLVQFVHGSFFSTVHEGLRRSRLLRPIGAVLVISLLPLFHPWPSVQTLKLTANFATVLLGVIYLCGIVTAPWMYREGILFFLFGLATQVVMGLGHDLMLSNPVSGELIHNNHTGILLAFSIFYAIPLCMPPSNTWQRALAIFCLAVLFAGLAFSCTRTAWISFMTGFAIFFYQVQRHSKLQKFRKRVLRLGLLFIGVLAVAAMNELAIISRLKDVAVLFNPDAWNHTFSDSQNFGFFGSFRLMQIFDLQGLLRTNGLFGVGFTHEIVGYHGFLFTLLGASGFAGLGLFLYFMRNLFHGLRTSMRSASEPQLVLIHISIFCALAVWFLCSFMETLFLQYSVWINVVSAIYAIHLAENREAF